MTNDEFCREFAGLVVKAAACLESRNIVMNEEEIGKLYLTAAPGGVLLPLYAVFNLRQSYMRHRIPFSSIDMYNFNRCIEHAGNHLEGYSVTENERRVPLLDVKSWIAEGRGFSQTE